MEQNLKQFLKAHRISVVGLLQKDGVVHSATMHYAYSDDPLIFFFMTDRNSKKCESLRNGETVNASLVIGFNEEEMCTFQAEGSLSFLTDEYKEKGWEIYTKKYLNRAKAKDDPDVVILQFTPNWGRFSDYRGELPIETMLNAT